MKYSNSNKDNTNRENDGIEKEVVEKKFQNIITISVEHGTFKHMLEELS